MNFSKLLFRAWYYFRQGYNTYLAFLVGFASNIIVIYRLGIEPNKYLQPFFPTLTFFTLVGVLVAVPVGVLAGLYHMKRTAAFAADASVATEANPYVYKTIGKEKEVFLPLWMMTVRGLAKLLEKQESLTTEDRKELRDILDKANALLEGESIGLSKEHGVREFPVTDSDA